jgi:hypothetical protein
MTYEEFEKDLNILKFNHVDYKYNKNMMTLQYGALLVEFIRDKDYFQVTPIHHTVENSVEVGSTSIDAYIVARVKLEEIRDMKHFNNVLNEIR